MRPDAELPAGLHVGALLALIVRHPWRYIGRRWNYKSAFTSSVMRAGLFFATNLTAGADAAAAAFLTEFAYRFVTSGYFGALTQAFRRVEPERTAMIAGMLVIPAVGHAMEFAVHWLGGTANLGASIAASLSLTMISTSFNLFAMRRGALVVGPGGASLLDDLRRLPGLFLAFVRAPL